MKILRVQLRDRRVAQRYCIVGDKRDHGVRAGRMQFGLQRREVRKNTLRERSGWNVSLSSAALPAWPAPCVLTVAKLA